MIDLDAHCKGHYGKIILQNYYLKNGELERQNEQILSCNLYYFLTKVIVVTYESEK